MADLAALKTELTTDPLGRGYAGMTDVQAADSLNAVNRPVEVPAHDVIRYLALVDKWGTIASDARHGNITAAKQTWCVNFVEILAIFNDFDLQDASVLSAVTARLDEGIGHGYIDASDKATILALGDNKQSRAQELGIGRVREGTVTQARA